jgi:hypothetical protein
MEINSIFLRNKKERGASQRHRKNWQKVSEADVEMGKNQ